MKERIILLWKRYKSYILYLVFGGCTTLINLLTYTVFTRLFQWDMQFSVVLSWICAVLFAFVTNKLFVFESKSLEKKRVLKEVVFFFGGRIFSLLMEMGIMFVFVTLLHMHDILIKLVANVFVIIANYFISKFLVFQNKEPK